MCCKALYSSMKLEKKSDYDIMKFVRTHLRGQTTEVITSNHASICLEYKHVFLVAMWNPNNPDHNPDDGPGEARVYGCQDLEGGEVVLLDIPQPGCYRSTTAATKHSNIEVFIRKDLGLDMICKSHGGWEFMVMVVEYRAPITQAAPA